VAILVHSREPYSLVYYFPIAPLHPGIPTARLDSSGWAWCFFCYRRKSRCAEKLSMLSSAQI